MAAIRLVFALTFLMMASSCTANQKEARWQAQHEKAMEHEAGLIGCDPYGSCLPGQCGEMDAGCGIILDCGSCPDACPEGQVRSCAGMGVYMPPEECPCLSEEQLKKRKPVCPEGQICTRIPSTQ